MTIEVKVNSGIVNAIKALSRGEASAAQQTEALKYIIHALAHTYHPSFAETERETAYNEGRRYVGLALVEIVNSKSRKRDGGEPREQPE